MRLLVTIQSIQNDARKNGKLADQVASWVKMNMRGLRQRYAQELEKKCGTGTILFTKGDLIQLIKNVGDFEQQGILWDSAHNLHQMSEMQNDVIQHRNKLLTFTRLYGGLVVAQYIVPGGPGSAGQPKKFFTLLPLLVTVLAHSEEDVDTMVFRHFKLGMSKFELGQFLITLGCDVDLRKIGRQLLQSRERGSQQSEPSTGQRGQTRMLQQITSWRSVLGNEMGDPAPAQQLPTALDEAVPPLMVMHFRPGFFKRPHPPPQFRIDKPLMPKSTTKSCTVSPVPSSVHVEEGAAEVSQRMREQSPSLGASD